MERERLSGERKGVSLKRIEPSSATLREWALILPPSHDQIFLPPNFSPQAVHGLSVEKLIPKASRKNWDLLDRSWFGYLANRAAYRIVLRAGAIERLPQQQRQKLKKSQIEMKNLALVPSRLLPAGLRDPERFTWLTANLFRRLRTREKIAAIRAWDKAGKLTGFYPRIPPSSIPAGPKSILKRRQLFRLANTFAPHSGPNCFATIAFAISGKNLRKWMHQPDFFKIVHNAGYKPVRGTPVAEDILICWQKRNTVHTALYLGGFVFEKPGQDLYEPYRIVRWSKWKKDWGHTRIETWRKT